MDSIEKINKLAPYEWETNEQGVFKEPYGIPDNIKEHVIYMRWRTGGVSGGSCWDTSNAQPYTEENGKPKFEVLDLVLKELMPTLMYSQYVDIEKLIKSSYKTDYEYYGNCTDYEMQYIVLSDLINLLKQFEK